MPPKVKKVIKPKSEEKINQDFIELRKLAKSSLKTIEELADTIGQALDACQDSLNEADELPETHSESDIKELEEEEKELKSDLKYCDTLIVELEKIIKRTKPEYYIKTKTGRVLERRSNTMENYLSYVKRMKDVVKDINELADQYDDDE